MKRIIITLIPFLLFVGSLSAQNTEQLPVTRVWDQAIHSAFTDLIRFKGHFYCSFREGSGHIPGTDGTVRILKSKDGKQWESVAHLTKTGIDLRDPKLSITPDGRLMIIIGGSIYEKSKLLGRHPHVSFSDTKGQQFSEPEKVQTDPSIASWGSWYWRVTWHKGVGYAIDYQIGPEERHGPTAMYLVKTLDGKKFEKVSAIELDGFPNEATIRFDKQDVMHVMIRRETKDHMGFWAVSRAPYQSWEYTKMNIRLGGPNFVFTPHDQIIASTRAYEPKVYTGIYIGEKQGNLKEVYHLPSSGDTSYPGLVLDRKNLYLSYYSSHEGKSAIYFTTIPLKQLQMKF